MRRLIPATLLSACLLAALLFGAQQGSAKPPLSHPKGFFGIGPQTLVTPEDYGYMRAGGIESVRVAVPWGSIQPTENGVFNWTGLDATVAAASRKGLRVLPFIYGTPSWLASNWRTLPVDTGKQRKAWRTFIKAAVARYGPGGDFWDEHAPSVVKYESESVPIGASPIRVWQIWNEANFFYFAYPVSPARYARLLKLTTPVIKSVDPSAQVLLTGLFGEPTAKGRRGMAATDFLQRLYRTPGIKRYFDAISLHPYAVDAETLEEMVEGLHEVTLENRDRPAFYITEMGWGSQNDFNQVAFEQGIRGQVKQLRASYGYLLENQRRLNLKGVYWFSWKDLPGSCNFCDSVGFFRAGEGFRPKPAWHAFVRLTGGRARP
ncbi:MAG TPA: beta-galactosidase [Solirubrobacterales bacterium]|nr:beta-galactosidase [Solirubrobacterales bacterium]